MVDPTWKEPCPACGYTTDVNQMGQVYSHEGANGCPYHGNGGVSQHSEIVALKFDYRPCMTAAAAYIEDGLGATVRYPEDGTDTLPAQGQYISMRTADNEVFGIARVERHIIGPVNEVFKEIWNSKARYPPEMSSDVVETLNGYYDAEIDAETTVVGVVYEPWIAEMFKQGPPIDDTL